MSHMLLNGVSSADMHFEYCVPVIPLLPERRPSTITIPGRDGVFDFDIDSYAPLPIPVYCMIRASSESELISYLAAAAVWLQGKKTIVFDRDLTKQWTGKIYKGVDLNTAELHKEFVIVFECNPYAEDVTPITDATIDEEQDYGSDLTFYPTITVNITDSTASLQVTLASTGKFVLISRSFVNGDVIVINMETGKTTLNGTSIPINITSNYFGVPPGNQTINVAADSTYTAVMAFKRRYQYA